MKMEKEQSARPRILAIIPARGNEVRVINKNTRDFLGKPIISYSIDAALSSCIFSEVMVSTEDENIAHLAKQCGAKVPFIRSIEHAADGVPVDAVILEVISMYEKMGKIFDWVCCIYPVAPFVTAKKLVNAYQILEKSEAYSLIGVVKTSGHPLRSMAITQNYVQYMWPEYGEINSADLEQAYEDAGQFYFAKIPYMKKSQSVITAKTIPYYLSTMETQRINSLDEWKIAESKYELYKSLYLREASVEDMWKLFNWRNDEYARKNFFQSDEISFESHKKWFINVMNSDDIRIYILMKGSVAIGQVRIGYTNGQATIAYSIDEKYRGNGYGRMMLRLIEDEIAKTIGNIHIRAEVLKDNIVSRRVFNSLGYQEKEKKDCYLYTKNASFSGNEPYEYPVFDTETSGNLEIELVNRNYCEDEGGVLFLTSNQNTINLYNWIVLNQQIPCVLFDGKISIDYVKSFKPQLIVSYNYVHIISKEIIDYMKGRIINLHISLLPWNRGYSPNLWSFVDNTPKGVTIHEINEGLDKGDIIFQKECFFDEKKETFSTTYRALNDEIQVLFKKHFHELYTGAYKKYPQVGKGSYHSKKDLEELYLGEGFAWDENISEVLRKK